MAVGQAVQTLTFVAVQVFVVHAEMAPAPVTVAPSQAVQVPVPR